jgi:galactolipid galactosyltransferase
MVRDRKMQVMLTLFHHSAPKWCAAYGGWVNPVSIQHFAEFTDIVVNTLGDLVDYWVPFNEPTVFVGLTYCAGAWPPGFPEPNPLKSGFCMMAPGLGNYSRAMSHIALAHRAAAKSIRRLYSAPIG